MAVGIAAALGAAAAWALASTVIAAQARHVDPFSLTAVRMIAAACFFVVAVPALGADADFGRMSATDIAWLMGQGFLASAIGETLYAVTIPLFGLNRTFMITMGTSVLFAFIFGSIFLGDDVTIAIGIGSVIVLVGIYIVASRGRPKTAVAAAADADGSSPRPRFALRRFVQTHRFAVGLALALGLGVLFGGASVWLRSASEGFAASAAASVRMPVVVPFVLLLALARPQSTMRRWAIPRRSLPWLFVSGAFGTGLLAVLVTLSLQHVSAGEFTVFFSVAPLFGMVLGLVFLGERVTRWLLLGAMLVLGGIAVITLA